jgi:hypothetical protein
MMESIDDEIHDDIRSERPSGGAATPLVVSYMTATVHAIRAARPTVSFRLRAFFVRAAPETGAAGYDIGMDIGYHIISMMSDMRLTADAPL